MLEVIKSLPLTFYSRAFYWQLIRKWEGIGAGFIIVLTVLGLISAAIEVRNPIREGMERVQALLESMPAVTVKDHKISIDKPTPYTISIYDNKGKDNEPNKLVIDPTYAGNIDSVSGYMKKNNILALVTSDKLIITKQRGNQVEVDDLSTLPDGSFTQEQWASIGTTISAWAFPVVLLASAIGLIISNFVKVLITAVILKVLSLIPKMEMDFSGAMRLAAASCIPLAIVTVFIPLFIWLKALIWIGFGIFGLTALRPDKSAQP